MNMEKETTNLWIWGTSFLHRNNSNESIHFEEPEKDILNITNFNSTLNTSSDEVDNSEDKSLNLVNLVVISALLGIVILATVVGNLFVIAAILLERNLRTVGNYLVLSLGVADLLVACLVMPLGAVYEVTQEWVLGAELCDIWTSCDVLCCTASILHLLAIAADRFWAVTNVDYIRRRGVKHVGSMIVIVWGVAFIVSLAPIFGWKDPDFPYRVEVEKRCLVSQDMSYQVFATCATFYVPLILILILYWRIYQVARKRIRHKPGRKLLPTSRRISEAASTSLVAEMTVMSTTSSSHPSSDYVCATNGLKEDMSTVPILPKKKKKLKKECLESKREKKAAKTLAIITGVFVICWLPFFVMALVMAVCDTCEPENYLFSCFLWLGYANSMLNPIIYTIFSPDFRNAFKSILCGAGRRDYRYKR